MHEAVSVRYIRFIRNVLIVCLTCVRPPSFFTPYSVSKEGGQKCLNEFSRRKLVFYFLTDK